MITSCKLSRRGLFGLFLSMTIAASKKFLSPDRLPEPQLKLGNRMKTERICNDRISQNYLGIAWECGFVVGYVWQFDESFKSDFREGWIYRLKFDESNYEEFSDRQWLDFVHETKLAIAKN